jgi:DNA-binding LacI/PurR family transcriptional regulator
MAQKVTLQTLADELGVSKQTVSNAFSRPDQLSAELRSRILAAAADRGYSGPDPSARALSRGSTGVVGVVLTERTADALADPAATEFLIGVTTALEPLGQSILLVSGRPDRPTAGSAIGDAAVDALILYSLSPDDPHIAAVKARHLPVVSVDQPLLDGHPLVGADQRVAGQLAARHLADLGHQHVSVLCLRTRRDGGAGLLEGERRRSIEFPLTAERLDGILEVVEHVDAVWECPTREAVPDAVDHILDVTPSTAIVAMSDDFALAAILALRKRGVDVPRQISVVGIDDVPLAAAVGLTTVRQDHRAKGAAAVAALTGGTSLAIELRIVERSSTAAPPHPAEGGGLHATQ